MVAATSDGPLVKGDRLKGHYYCSQGRTELTLVIEDARADEIDAVFEFAFAGSATHKAAAGSYRMHGNLDRKSGALRLVAGDWIDQPEGHGTVDLSGVVATTGTQQSYKGSVIAPDRGSSCSTFLVTKGPPRIRGD